jgi:hypothetical protein
MVIPDVSHPSLSKFCHRVSISRNRTTSYFSNLRFAQTVVPSPNHHSGRQAFNIPLPEPRQRFVKIVQVKYEVSFRRRRGSNPCCEFCNQLSCNDLEKIANCPLAFWECAEVSECPKMSQVDSVLLELVIRWPGLEDTTREAIAALVCND